MTRRDRWKMIDFISSRLPDGGLAMLVLASGHDGDIVAEVEVKGDDVEIRSNCPEWVGIREVYDHLRWQAMPGWEQQKWIRAMALLERASSPKWDTKSGILSLGNKSWKFRVQVGPVVDLLEELQRKNWSRSVTVSDLSPDQVREAARVLRKTRPSIEWTATAEGTLSWRLR